MDNVPVSATQKYKDRLFRAVFSEKKELLELYNALRGTDYDNPDYDLTASVNLAVDECIRRDILAEFLRRNRAEVMNMMWYEYNEEEHIASEKEISFEEGKAEGNMEGEERVSRLNCLLIADKRYDDLERASRDKEYRNQLFESLGI